MTLYQYNQDSIIPFGSVDYGYVSEAESFTEDYGDLLVVAQTTILPDDFAASYSGVFSNTTVENSGTGTGSTGGFNIGRHIRFNGSGQPRYFQFEFDATNRTDLTVEVIRGSDTNGGEDPDTVNESLILQYSLNSGTSWTTISTVVNYNDSSFDVLKEVTITIPEAAKTSSTLFRFYQENHSGANWDNYGITFVEFAGETFTTDDYGFLTPTRQDLPYGRLRINNEFASHSLLRNSVGGISFLVGGQARIFTLPIHVGSGFLRPGGSLVEKNTENYVGIGVFRPFTGAAEATSNATPVNIQLFSVSGVVIESFGKGNYTASGTFSAFTGVAEVASFAGGTRQKLFEVIGTAPHSHTQNYVGTGNLFGYIGAGESKKIAQRAKGLFRITGSAIEKTPTNNVSKGTFSILGGAGESVSTAITPGTGNIYVTGAITNEHIKYHQFGTGTFTAISGNAQVERVAYDYNESSIVNVDSENYGLITEGQTDEPISQYANDPISLYANEIISEFGIFDNRDDFGNIAAPDGSNLTLPYDRQDWGLITDDENRFPFGKLQFEDGGDLAYESGGIKFRVRPITPGPTFRMEGEASVFTLPIHVGGGLTRIGGKSVIRIRSVYYGSGTFSAFTGSAEATSNAVPTTPILFEINGNSHNTLGVVEIGSGSLFTLVSKTESISSVENKTVLFKFTGAAVEKNTESYFGDGTLFGFINGAESTAVLAKPEVLFKISGSAIEKNTEDYVGTGSLFSFVSASESTSNVEVPTPTLFRFSGAATNIQVRYHQIVTGSLFGYSSTSYTEKVTYDYNESSIVNVRADNWGLITEGISDAPVSDYANDSISLYANEVVSEFGRFGNREDFGNISDPDSNNVSLPYDRDDWGLITDNENRFPFGVFRFNEQGPGAQVKFQVVLPVQGPVFHLRGAVDVFVLPVHVGEGITRIGGESVIRIRSVYYGSGTFSTFTGAAEATSNVDSGRKVLFRISGDSHNTLGVDEIGTGSLFTFISKTESTSSAEKPIPTLFRFTGSAVEKNTESYNGSGTLFGFINGAESTAVLAKPEGLFNISGSAIEKNTENYVGTGSLFTFISKTESTSNVEVPTPTLFRFSGAATNIQVRYHQIVTGSLFGYSSTSYAEKVTYDYNESSIVNVRADNWGLITEGISDSAVGDYANDSISLYANEIVSDFGREPNREDFGNITIDPYLSVHKSLPYDRDDWGLITDDENRFPFGVLRFDEQGAAVQVKFQVVLPVKGPVFHVRGNAGEYTVSSHTGSGFTKISGESVIRIRSAYIGTGTIFSFVGGAEATSSVPPTQAPLLDFNGTARERFGKGNYNASGIFSAFTGAAESTLISDTSNGLFKFSGTVVEKNTENYVGSGNLFGFINSAESTAVLDTASVLFKFSGSAVERNTENYVGRGSLFTFISKTESTSNVEVPSPTLFRFSGAATNVQFTASHLGTGSLFGIIGHAEKVTWDYNCHSSIVNVRAEDYGFITEGFSDSPISDYSNDPISLYANEVVSDFGRYPRREDFGHISIDPEQSINTHGYNHDDWGLITDDENRFPCGRFRYEGKGGIVRVAVYKGSGTFSTFGGAAEVVAKTDDTFGLFKVNGSAGIIASLAHVGSGLTKIGDSGLDKFVRVQFIPKISGVLINIEGAYQDLKATYAEVGTGTLRLGLSSPGVTGDGSRGITTFHLGHIGSGLFNLNGNAVEKNTESYVGSGSLFSFIGGAESITKDLPDTATLFKFSGSAIEKNTEVYVGRGSLFTFVSKTESTSSTDPVRGSLFKFTGFAVEKNTEAYRGSGTFSTFTGAAEARAVTKVTTGIFKFFGNSPESTTPAPHIGSGSLFTFVSKTESTSSTDPVRGTLFRIGGDGTIGIGLGQIGSGVYHFREKVSRPDATGKNVYRSSEERIASVPPISGENFFNIEGRVKIFFVYQDIGSGSFNISGDAYTEVTPRHTGSGFFNVFGESEHSITRIYTGSGSLFTFIGGEDSTTVDLPPQAGLLRFAGAATEKFTLGPEIGDVSLRLSSSDVFVRFNLSHIGSGQFSIDGDVDDSVSRDFVGSGSLFAFTGSAESRTIDLPPFAPTLFRFVGAGVEKNTEAYKGTGSLFGFDSATEVRVASPELSGLFKVKGNAAVASARDFIGSGSVTFNTKGIVEDPNGKIVYVSAEESITSVPPTDTQVFTFTGSAVTKEDRSWNGTGGLFGFSGSAERVAFSPAPLGLFKVTGRGAESRTRIYSGSGSLFGIVSKVESTEVIATTGGLFKITGSVTVVRGFPPCIGSGSFSSFTGAAESRTIAPPVATLFTFQSGANESTGREYAGSGRLATFQSATLSRRVPYVAKVLFTIFGTINEAFTPSGYTGSTQVQFIGASQDKKINYESPKPTRIYIV